MNELERLFVEDIEALRFWLQLNYAQNTSVWLVRWKKGIGKSYISYDDIVDELI